MDLFKETISKEEPFALENYMYLTQQETPEVDADWKKPLLKKLDAELDTRKSDEANAPIFDIIGKVLNAETETEAREIMSEQQRKQERELDNYDKLTSQTDNIYNSDKLQLSEVRHIAELAMNAISDEITRLQTDPEEKGRMFPELKTDLDFTKATRKQIIDAIGINTLLEYAKKLFDPSRYDDIDIMWQAWDIMDNWDGIIQFGSDVFVLNEGFGINKDFDKDKYETNGRQSVELGSEMYGDDVTIPSDIDGIAENGSKQEHLQVEFRTIDTVNDLINNILVKRALHDCYLKDEDGNVIISKWGIPERVPVRDAVQSILHWVQGTNGLAEMIANLESHVAGNRWLESLIEKLKDPSQSTMQSQFTGVFWKPFQLMGVVTYDKKKGKYISKPVNRHPALSETMNRIKVDFQAAMHPLFIGYGKDVRVNMDYLGTEESTHDLFDKTKPITLRRALAYLNEIKRTYNAQQGNKVFTKEMAEESIPYLTAVCRRLGFYADESLVRSAVMMTENDSRTNEKKYNPQAFNTMTTKLGFIVEALDKAVTKERAEQENPTPDYAGYDPFKFMGENSILGSLTDFLTPVTNQLEDTYNSSVYDSGKMYQSYVIPSHMTLLMNKLKSNKVKANNIEQEFITDFYGKSEWFGVPGAGGRMVWRNEMLKELALNPKAREIFEHRVELNFNKHNFMRTMSPQEQTLAMITEYYAERNETGDRNRAVSWYKIPMESNKPSAEYIKFWSYRGEPDVYKANITRDLFRMFLQEFSRIQTVRMRNKDKSDPGFIENWDVNGRKFCFLPFFNQYLEGKGTLLQNVEGYTAEDDALLAKEIKERLSGENIDFSLADEFHGDSNGKDTRFVNMVKDAINYFMEQRTNTILDAWEKEDILKEAKKIEHVNDPRKDVENFIWNHYLMAKNILQLTIGDIAFYKDAEDLQKRLAQLHSPGIRGNKYATWNVVRDGKVVAERVSDGFYRTVVAKDLRKQMNFHSNLIANLTEVLDKKYEDAPDYEKEGWLMLKDSLVGEHGLYRDVNVTDAQAYSSPTSYRKKAVIFGKWSDEAETVYNKLLDGTATLSDVRMAFQPLKPFVYGLLEKNLGVDEAPITTMLEPFQAKNSEYLLIMADALLQNEETSQPNLLRAIYQVMEDSYFVGRERDANGKIIKQGTYTGKGIDTVQFESAIKSSLQGAIDIGEHWNNIDGEAEVVRMLEDRIYKKDANGRIMRDEYDEMTYVHKLDYDNYCIQQEVPEHFRDHDQTHGSQIRMITHSDLDYYYDPNGDLSDPANVVMYEVREYDKESGKFITKKLTADQFKREYEETIAENLDHSYEKLVQELQIEGTKKERNLALSKILRREILNSPRYGIDLLLACTVDKEGNFRIPKGDPIQAKRIEQLCNSIIKNRLNKQEIAGGPIVQVTNFGTRRLSVVFKDKFTGGLLLTEDQWNQKIASSEELPVSMTGKAYGSYSEYIDGRQGGIAHFECFAPAWSKEIFDKFTRSDGSIDIEAIDRLDPDLLKMVGYRIPTEDKYSCAPLKIKGFLPAIAGEAIMMPYELTTINDSDFDVDKEYVMRKVIFINLKDNERIAEDMWKSVKHWNDVSSSLEVKEMIYDFVQNPDEYKDKDAFYERLWNEYIRNAYYTSHPKEGTLYRNNKIVDMTYEVLSHETNVMKILKPGGFDNLKKPAYLIEAFRLNVNNEKYNLTEQEEDAIRERVAKETSHTLDSSAFVGEILRELKKARYKKAWDELSKLSMDELKKLCDIDKDLAWVDTEIQFYKQNAAAASLIGVQAVNKIAHAVLEGDCFHIDVGSLCGDFVIGGNMDENGNYAGGKYFGGMMEVDKTYNDNGELIGKTLGSTVSASADASKYPIYNLVNVNMATVNIMNTLLRFGMPDAQVFRFMSQDVITRTIEEYNKANLSGNASLAGTVETMMGRIKEEHASNLPSDSQLFSEELSDDEMIEGILPGNHPEIDLKVLNIVQKLLAISGVMRNLDHPTRFNSVSSAVGPLIIDNLISEYKINKFTIGGAGEAGTRIYTRYKEEDLTDEDRRILNNPDTPDNHPLKLGFKQADFFTVLDKHPILAGFHRGLDIAKRLFRDMPAGSEGFRNLLNSLPENVQDSLFNDKKLLDKLCIFYQTYMLVAAGLLNPGKVIKEGDVEKTEFEIYIKDFPKEFMEMEKSEQFRKEFDLDNNPFVKAIQYDVDSESGNFYLKMNLTGLDTQVKQSLIDGWVDLFKKSEKGKDLATKLMIYNIYRGGIGFSPKTFTALISTYLKENFSGKDRNGNEVRYKDIFNPEKWPSMNNERIFDQFVRNNWDDYRLVKDMSKAKKLGIDYTKGELTVRTDYSMDGSKDDSAVREVRPYKYITTERYLNTKDSNGKPQSVKVTLLWKKEFDSDNVLTYKLIKPLGNNGEYLEMDINDIRNPLTDTYTVMPQEDSSTIREQSSAEKEVTSNDKVDALSEAQKERNLNTVKERLVDRFISNNRNSGRNMTLEDAEKRLEKIKEDLKNPGNHNKYRKFLHNLLSQIGVEVDMDKTIEKFLEFC